MKLLSSSTTPGTLSRLAKIVLRRPGAVSSVSSLLPAETSADSSTRQKRPIHSHTSFCDASSYYLPQSRSRSSLGEPSYYSNSSAAPQEGTGVTEFDYGYRVSPPTTSRLYTTTTTASSPLPMDHPATAEQAVDEYAFIMSSPDPVSAQECSNGVVDAASVEDSSFFFTADDRRAWNSLAHHESAGLPEQQVILDAANFEWEDNPTQEDYEYDVDDAEVCMD